MSCEHRKMSQSEAITVLQSVYYGESHCNTTRFQRRSFTGVSPNISSILTLVTSLAHNSQEPLISPSDSTVLVGTFFYNNLIGIRKEYC